ncbi:spore germination protein KB [Caldanaerobius fijiensis DSM 17918]|uniref:Spore germination protein KB n=1 Tax=Caldanaerobius fijiensis DSM 17918 TaxID=1121256 RepID=A0A1M4SPG8_9THEO|nr:GerAB/ArcD/ProY family transporter [Caldanaerobius fijiensis]SHE34143.1 spore germination protein KB [Caldanaerobius fijiensis DSM 17918]
MKTKISVYQMFAAMILHPLGSTILFFLTPEAKQDAWIAMLVYIPAGILLQLIYTTLYYQYPDDTIVTYLPKIFGRFIGYILSIVYITYFAYLAARVLRDFAELSLIAIMPETPLIVASAMFMSAIAYTVFTGLENLARAAQIALPISIFVFITEYALLFVTPGVVKFDNLKPVLENGIIHVIKAGWLLITFPFGETVTFAMIYPSVNEPSKVRKAAFMAIIFEGILLTVNTIIYIASLGINFATTALFPLLETLRLIKVGFIERLDILLVVIMALGGLFKISIFMYASMLGTAQLIKLKDPKYLALPFGIGIIIFSILIAKNYPQHIQLGLEWTPVYIHIPIQIIIPVSALIVHFIKKWISLSK